MSFGPPWARVPKRSYSLRGVGHLRRAILRRSMTVAIGVVLVLMLGAAAAGADSSVMYASSNGAAGGGHPATLVTVNLTTGVATAVGPLPFPIGVQEIVCQPHPASVATAICYAQESGSAAPNGTMISQFNLATGAPIGSPVNDGTFFPGLAYVGATLYGTSFDGFSNDPSFLQILNPTTGATTLIGPTGVSHPITGLAWDGTTMYGVSGGALSSLYTINLTTGHATLVGATGHTLGSLQFGPDGTLYAGGDSADVGHLYRLDKTTGAATLVGASGVGSLTGLALVTFSPSLTTTSAPAAAPVLTVVPRFTG
jgi:hypothetical protein